eukprot:COSAG02_NODE_8758_length_2454_cov_1.634820_3_plen_140_part_00
MLGTIVFTVSAPQKAAYLALVSVAPPFGDSANRCVYAAKKQVYAVAATAFDERGLKSFVEGLLTGRQKVAPYPSDGLPSIAETAEWDGKDAPVEEDSGLDDDMAEFLREQQAAREAEEAEAAAAATADTGTEHDDDSDL